MVDGRLDLDAQPVDARQQRPVLLPGALVHVGVHSEQPGEAVALLADLAQPALTAVTVASGDWDAALSAPALRVTWASVVSTSASASRTSTGNAAGCWSSGAK